MFSALRLLSRLLLSKHRARRETAASQGRMSRGAADCNTQNTLFRDLCASIGQTNVVECGSDVGARRVAFFAALSRARGNAGVPDRLPMSKMPKCLFCRLDHDSKTNVAEWLVRRL
jgi:hypothetical protein